MYTLVTLVFIQVVQLHNYMVVQRYNRIVVKLHNHMLVQPRNHSCTTITYSCKTTQPHSCTTQLHSCKTKQPRSCKTIQPHAIQSKAIQIRKILIVFTRFLSI